MGSNSTTPIFVVGSGRSGTRMIYKLLSGYPHIEIYHEYLCTHIQQYAALYFMKRISSDVLQKKFMELHGAGIYYSQSQYWIDCSNKISWIIEPILDLFPQAKFVHLVRDGRKVAASYFHKLNHEMYDDQSIKIMEEWLKNSDKLPMPPPEKKYWWNIPQNGQPFADDFGQFDQFQRACYQWRESNRVVNESLAKISEEQKLIVRLEDITKKPEVLKKFLNFFNLDYEDHFFEFLQTPQNVIFPMDFKLTTKQIEQFNYIAGDMMENFGYAETEEYNVEY
ncbi:sulfotransferase [Nostoc sp. UHCC 0926]|uniref:sulfotransferase family protein n=1 Tax=unclassified Nostoc TaxID=2593658 RepID=UPI0023621D2E|nr:sulfotransferase [Nostoc sp. UHCC 0926]WDD30863.1 sulfotransferase [Nostoc sp. UHCC 0926]